MALVPTNNVNNEDPQHLLFDFDVNPLRDPDPSRQRRQIIRVQELHKSRGDAFDEVLDSLPPNLRYSIRPNAAEAQLTADPIEIRAVIIGLWRGVEQEKRKAHATVEDQSTWAPIITDRSALRVVARMDKPDIHFYVLTPAPTHPRPGLSIGYLIRQSEIYFFPEFRDDGCANKGGDDGRSRVWVAKVRDFTGGSSATNSGSKNGRPAKRRATSSSVSAQNTPLTTQSTLLPSLAAVAQHHQHAYPHQDMATSMVSPGSMPTTQYHQGLSSTIPSYGSVSVNYLPFQSSDNATAGMKQSPTVCQPRQRMSPPALLPSQSIDQAHMVNTYLPAHYPQDFINVTSFRPATQPTNNFKPVNVSDTNLHLPDSTHPIILPDVHREFTTPQDDRDSLQVERAIVASLMEERHRLYMREIAMSGRLLAELNRQEKRLMIGAQENGWDLVKKDYTAAVHATFSPENTSKPSSTTKTPQFDESRNTSITAPTPSPLPTDSRTGANNTTKDALQGATAYVQPGLRAFTPVIIQGETHPLTTISAHSSPVPHNDAGVHGTSTITGSTDEEHENADHNMDVDQVNDLDASEE